MSGPVALYAAQDMMTGHRVTILTNETQGVADKSILTSFSVPCVVYEKEGEVRKELSVLKPILVFQGWRKSETETHGRWAGDDGIQISAGIGACRLFS